MADFSDYAWLVEDAATALLSGLATDERPALAQLESLRRQLPAERARLLVEQAELRRRAVTKFGALAARMFFTPVLLEQATDLQLARYKSARLTKSGQTVHDFCCGIGGDLLALYERGPAVGWDRSEIACLLAAANVEASMANAARNADGGHGGSGAKRVRLADVATVSPATGEVWHVDPDRRAAGSRATKIELLSPGPEVFELWRRAAPDGAVKLAPATEVSDAWQQEAELEWITSQRECRQLVAWFGNLAAESGLRRATVLGGSTSQASAAAGTFVGRPGQPLGAADHPARFVFDPDPAILAADLLGAVGAHYGLSSLGAGGAYLTGDAVVDDPLLQAFEVLACMPLRLPMVEQALAARKIGRLEIKKRGVSLDPQAARRRLKLSGEGAATLFLTRIGKREVAIIAERMASPVG